MCAFGIRQSSKALCSLFESVVLGVMAANVLNSVCETSKMVDSSQDLSV